MMLALFICQKIFLLEANIMGSVNVRKRGKVYQYQFEAASVDGKRKQITKSGFKTKKESEIESTKAYNEYNNTRSFVYSCDNVIF